ncbi:MAG: biotin transporter BioY [Hydrogenibacillus schlegelii]|nr:biotin transporter BioY [Hydrogenibacillus schlegelii]
MRMRYTPREIARIALFVALAAASVYLARLIPPVVIFGTGVPVSFMPAISALAGILLGARNGATAMFVYLVAGLIGLPVYAGGTGGIGHVLAPTFGFILGFIAAAWVAGRIAGLSSHPARLVVASVLALVPLYAVGIVYMAAVLNLYLHQPAPIAGLVLSMTPFVVKDVVENAAAGLLAAALIRRLFPERLGTVAGEAGAREGA